MTSIFDEIIERKNTQSLKFDSALRRGRPEGLLPLWVADMDFRTPPCVIEALHEKSSHGIFGYTESGEAYFAAVRDWYARYFSYAVQPEWLVETPGVVFAVCAAIRALTREGDAVLIQPPVYYPFAHSIHDNGRRLIENQLVCREGRYSVDFADFEHKITENDVRMFILCSPHNPVGRVWTREELLRMGDICLAHGVIVIADEIHADFVYPGHRHYVFSTLRPEYESNSIVCTAPSKTFNLAGLQVSNILIQDKALRGSVQAEIDRTGYGHHLNTMGVAACRAAYEGGREWLDALLLYLADNLSYMREFLEQNAPRIRMEQPEGTYLAWLDCAGLGLNDAQLKEFMQDKAGLWLDEGTMFGPGGEGYVRVNAACPRAVLEQAMQQLTQAVAGL